MRHIISVLVENEFGVLARIAGLFSGRFNIESLCVAPTTDPTVSRITLVTSGDDRVLEQISKHLNKLVNVIKVSDFSTVDHVERELVMVKVTADDAKTRGEVLKRREHLLRRQGRRRIERVVRRRGDGQPRTRSGVHQPAAAVGIKEVVRTGVVAMFRGSPGARRGGGRYRRPRRKVRKGASRAKAPADFV